MRCLPMRFTSRAWPKSIVDLVRAGMRQVLAFEVDARAAQLLGQTRGDTSAG